MKLYKKKDECDEPEMVSVGGLDLFDEAKLYSIMASTQVVKGIDHKGCKCDGTLLFIQHIIPQSFTAIMDAKAKIDE